MHSDPILLAKIIRLGRTFMKDKTSRNAEEHSDRVSKSCPTKQERFLVFHRKRYLEGSSQPWTR